MKPVFNTEQLVQRFEDRREIKNVMGKYVTSILVKREATMFDTFWSQRGDICLGVNTGWYSGRDAIRGYYAGKVAHVEAVRDLLIRLYPEQVKKQNGEATAEELYGMGILESRSITNAVIEIAADGATAKGLWCQFANVTDVDRRGPLSNWVMAYMAVDFIREDEQWKLWHMQYLEEVNSPCGVNWSVPDTKYPPQPEYLELDQVAVPAPNRPMTLRVPYSLNRPFTPTPRIPVPYESFSDTFSYGMDQGVETQ